jgi:hypothetical protein
MLAKANGKGTEGIEETEETEGAGWFSNPVVLSRVGKDSLPVFFCNLITILRIYMVREKHNLGFTCHSSRRQFGLLKNKLIQKDYIRITDKLINITYNKIKVKIKIKVKVK